MAQIPVKMAIFIVVFGLFVMITNAKTSVKKDVFGKTADGKTVDIYTLRNSNRVEAKIITYGGTVVSLKVPDKNRKLADVVLGYDSVADYEKNNFYIGALIGRYGNRIANGKFSLDGKEFQLAKNNGENSLHGGPNGFHRVIWKAKSSTGKDGANLELTYLSKDGEEGFPGTLSVKVIYTLTENNELKIVYSATTDQETIANLTHHSYFNLSGAGNGLILNHQMMINADKFTPINSVSIPTGEIKSVKNSPFDFTTAHSIGKYIGDENEQLKYGSGYDHNWVLTKRANELLLAARVFEPESGRVMEVLTTEPGIQFYSGNFLDGSIPGKNNQNYPFRSAFCLEAQHFPDSPNEPNFPSTVLKKGETYHQTTIYKFSTR